MRKCIPLAALAFFLSASAAAAGLDAEGHFRDPRLAAAQGDPGAVDDMVWRTGGADSAYWPELEAIAAAGGYFPFVAMIEERNKQDIAAGATGPSERILADFRFSAETLGYGSHIVAVAVHSLTGYWGRPENGDFIRELAAKAQAGDREALSLACRLAVLPNLLMENYIPFCHKGATLDMPEAHYALALLHHGRPDNIVQGMAVAARKLAGKGPHPAAALQHYRRAAELGHAGAQARLAHLLAIGRETARNDTEARAWAERSAASDWPEGKAVLGLLLLQGRGGPADSARALPLLEQAARGGVEMAQLTLATLHFRGRLVARDFVQAQIWLRLSERTGPGGVPEVEADPLLLEPIRRTMRLGWSMRIPPLRLDAAARAATLRKQLAESGEWPYFPKIAAR